MMAAEDMISDEDGLERDVSDMSEEEIEEEAARLAAEEVKANQARRESLTNLAQSIEARWYHRALRRKQKENEWRKSIELYLGNLSAQVEISPDSPLADQRQKSRVYHNIVGNKCDIAIAQSVDMQFAGGEKNWSLASAPNTLDPADRERARLMEGEIESQLEHCGYGRKARRAIEDRVIMGSGILKGPVNTGKPITRYEQIPDAPDVWVPVQDAVNYPAIERVNPWFYYPDDTVNEFCQVTDSIEVHPSSALDLKRLMQHPGFDPVALADAIAERPKDYMLETYSDYTSITSSNPYLFEDKFMLLEYHGPITQEQLDMLSIEPSYESVNNEYYGEIWVVCGRVVRIELENIEASYELPYALSTWKKDPASVFGFGSPLLMLDAQRVAREVWRMILDNASLSSGPQVASHSVYVEPVNGSWELAPNKAWRLLDSQVDVEKAIQFFNVPNHTQELIPILNLARQFGEEESMTPMIAGGLQGGQAMESASGALMMQEASTTILDFLSEDWDDNVTEKVIRRFYAWNMQYNPRPEIKGNYSVDVRTASEYKTSQMYLRDMERLSMEIAQNPDLGAIVNMDELYRARLSAMRIPYTGIVKSPEEVEKLRQQAAQQPNPQMMEMQFRQAELQMEERKLALREMELQFNAKQAQQREAWDHEQKMTANYVRTLEAEARVIASQNEKDIEYLKLAQKSEDAAERNRITREIAIANLEYKKFTDSMSANLKAREQMLTAEELLLARDTGDGI